MGSLIEMSLMESYYYSYLHHIFSQTSFLFLLFFLPVSSHIYSLPLLFSLIFLPFFLFVPFSMGEMEMAIVVFLPYVFGTLCFFFPRFFPSVASFSTISSFFLFVFLALRGVLCLLCVCLCGLLWIYSQGVMVFFLSLSLSFPFLLSISFYYFTFYFSFPNNAKYSKDINYTLHLTLAF